MAKTDVNRINRLLLDGAAPPVRPGDPDKESVAIIQELLSCHGYVGLPRIFDSARGIFGPKTTIATRSFQNSQGLPETAMVDRETLRALITAPAVKPLACHGYLSLVLDFAFKGMVRLVSLTSQFEGGGSFIAINPNSDCAGLSFGIIQWAQRPGRLHEILYAFQNQCPTDFLQIFGGGDARLASRLIEHTAKPSGGTDGKGRTTDPALDLTCEPWRTRFRRAGLSVELQKVQINCAADAFTNSYRQLQQYAHALRSERAIAFMLDLANQHGDRGARSIFNRVFRPNLSEPDLLRAIQNESVARVARRFGNGPEATSTRTRRQAFRTSSLLSDEPFFA